jgi:hypothetical protein
MTEYVLELYVSRSDARLAVQRGRRARAAAAELTRRGTAVRYHRAIFVPDEETCFLLFEAESVAAVRETARLAALPSDHINAAITQT